eukprot:7150756-Prymnesium_polylepis.1
MVPSHVMLIGEMPITANGKRDCRALPPPDWAAAAIVSTGANHEGGEMEDPLEIQVSQVWRSALRIGTAQPLSRDADFFDEAGGDSLGAIRLLAGLRGLAGVSAKSMGVGDLFEQRTVRLQAQLLKARGVGKDAEVTRGNADTHNVGIGVESRVGDFAALAPYASTLPLSPLQEFIWLKFDSNRQDITNNVPSAFAFTGVLDVAALEKVAAGVIAHHTVLHSVVVIADEPGGQPLTMKRPVDTGSKKWWMHLRGLSAAQLVQEAQQVMVMPFDLAADSLVRVHVLSAEGALDHIVVLCIHHLVTDG